MADDLNTLAGNILQAMKGVFNVQWNTVRPYATAEAQKLAATAIQIEQGQADGSINSQQAAILLDMQKNATQAVLTSIETVGMIAAQDAINAAIGVVTATVNKAVGAAIL